MKHGVSQIFLLFYIATPNFIDDRTVDSLYVLNVQNTVFKISIWIWIVYFMADESASHSIL